MNEPIEEAPQPVDAPHEHLLGQNITLTTYTLGLEPYVLIRAVKANPEDGDDESVRLKVSHNDDGVSLATLYVLNLPADQNPLTAAIKALIDANPGDRTIAEVLALFAEFIDLPMPESGS